MALGRQKKRVLAQMLVREAKRIVAEWDKKYKNSDQSLSDVESQEVEELFAGWLRHLPDDSWNKVDQPAVDDTVGHTSETYNGNASETTVTTSHNVPENSNNYSDADHVNTAVNPETPIMGDNDLHDEDEVLVIEDEDSTGSEDPAQRGGPFPETP